MDLCVCVCVFNTTRVSCRDPFGAHNLFSIFWVCAKCSIRMIDRLQHALTDLPPTPAEIQHFLLGCRNKNSQSKTKHKNCANSSEMAAEICWDVSPPLHTLAPFVVQQQIRDPGGDAGFSPPNFLQQLLSLGLLDLLLLADTLLDTLLLLTYRNTRTGCEKMIYIRKRIYPELVSESKLCDCKSVYSKSKDKSN